MSMIPLPPGSNAAQTIRRLRAIDAEIFGTLFASAGVIGGDVTIEGDLVGSDIYSSNWDGTTPLALPDSGASLGYALEGDSGKSQFHDDMFMSGVLTVALKAGTGFGDYRVIIDPAEFSYGPGISMVMDPDDNENYYAGITTSEPTKTMYVEGATGLGHSISARPYIELVGSTNSDAGYAASVPNMGMRINAGLYRGLVINGTHVHSVAPGQFLADNATSSAHDEGMPAYSFWNATDTGMWLADSDKIGFTVSDSRIMEITTSLVQSGLSTTGTFSMPRAVGTAAAPAYSFRGDSNTGMYRSGANTIAFATLGARRFGISDTAFFSPSAYGPLLTYAAGSASLPAYSFNADADTGMYRIGTNNIGWATGGAQRMELSSAHLRLAGSVQLEAEPTTTGSAANATWLLTGGTVYNLRRNTSARKYKRHINYDIDLADYVLRPAEFYRPDDDKWFIDFIADDLADQDQRMGVYDDAGEIENYHKPSVLAVLAAKVNRLEEQMERCNCECGR